MSVLLLQDTDTITGVTPLLLRLLSVVPVRCRDCDCLVPAPQYHSHRANSCVIRPGSTDEEKRLSVQSILRRDTDAPSSTVEDLLGSLVKRSLSQKLRDQDWRAGPKFNTKCYDKILYVHSQATYTHGCSKVVFVTRLPRRSSTVDEGASVSLLKIDWTLPVLLWP